MYYGGYNNSIIDLSNASTIDGYSYDNIISAASGPYKYTLLETYNIAKFNWAPPSEGLYFILVQCGYTCTERSTSTVTYLTSLVASGTETSRNYTSETMVSYNGTIDYRSSATLMTYPFEAMIIPKGQSWILRNLVASTIGYYHITSNYTYEKCEYLYLSVSDNVSLSNLNIRVYQVT